MKECCEELRPCSGENFQVGLQITKKGDVAFTPPHRHDFVEVLYCLKGNYVITVNGDKFLFKPEDMVIIGSRSIHEISPVDDPEGNYLVVKFQPEMIYSSYLSSIELKYVLPFIFNNADGKYIFSAEKMKNSGLKNVFKNIKKEIKEQKYGYEIALKSDIYKIVLWVVRSLEEEKGILSLYTEQTVEKIEKALKYIEKNYQKPLTVKEIAENSYMEYTYFSRIFKQITSMSCCDYINYFRVKKSEALILENELNITQIAGKVGFDSVSYYIKNFKRFNGKSPKKYNLTQISHTSETAGDCGFRQKT